MPIEITYGIVTIYKEDNKYLFLILQHDDAEGSWSFPKGHHEGVETPEETALRELKEETGINEIELIDTPLIHEEYEIIINGEKRLKINEYFIGFVKNKTIYIQENEIHAYKWATFEEALKTFTYETRKEVLKIAKKYIENESLK